MTQFTRSHHGILIREKITTYLDAKGKSKRTCFLCEELIKTKTPDFIRGKLHERVKLFSMQCKIGDFHKDFYIKRSKNYPTTRSYYKILGIFSPLKSHSIFFKQHFIICNLNAWFIDYQWIIVAKKYMKLILIIPLSQTSIDP